MRTGIGAAALAAALALPPAARGAQPAVVSLDHPGVRSAYAFVDRRTVARAAPSATAPAVARIGMRTEDGTDELLGLIARTVDAQGATWLRARLPVRPNGTTGWVPADDLSTPQPVHTWLRIDTHTLWATLVRSRRVVLRARIGVGRSRWPTPHGRFYVRDRLTGYGGKGSFYGPVAFGTSAHSDVLTDWPGGGIVGIHGTSLPELIPGRVSHGCVRLRNPDILRLARLMPIGTPITIR